MTPAPPPPPEEQESDVGFAGNVFPAKFRCAFPQRIDADGPPPEIIWNPGGSELPEGYSPVRTGGSGGDQAPRQLSTATQIVFAHNQLLGERFPQKLSSRTSVSVQLGRTDLVQAES